MNNRAVTLSLLMALVGVFFVRNYVTSIEDEQRKRFGTEVLVLKASRNINEQETVVETMVTLERVPKKFLEPAAVYFDKGDDEDAPEPDERTKALTIREVVGSVALVPIKKDEQITRNKLTEPGIRTGLAPQVRPGFRAVTIPVTEVSSVGKLVKPGDRVDVIAMLTPGGRKENAVVKTMIQEAEVLAVGRNVTNNVARVLEADPVTGKEKVKSLTQDFAFSSVTLQVTPREAQELALAQGNGDAALSLSLRNNDETGKLEIPPITLQDILGADADRILRTPAAQPRR